jgi:hypothetical protein
VPAALPLRININILLGASDVPITWRCKSLLTKPEQAFAHPSVPYSCCCLLGYC